jgi:tetratricopeptide (TPR) repeat protein
LAQAWKGIAYSQRKLGNYREAEAAYEKVLEIAPTAAHHFLMAQFQDDAQQGAKAQLHAYKAAEINPRAYRAQTDQLVNGMLGEQFGCWSIFRNRKP